MYTFANLNPKYWSDRGGVPKKVVLKGFLLVIILTTLNAVIAVSAVSVVSAVTAVRS